MIRVVYEILDESKSYNHRRTAQEEILMYTIYITLNYLDDTIS